jgi:DNA polymerase-1
MISRINEGVDLHTITAQAVYGLGSEPPTSQQRQVAKSANFTRIYGGGAKKFADTAKIDEIEAKSFYRRLDEEFPTAKIFMQTVESKARERLSSEGRAYVRTLGGRICETSEDKLYKLVNYVIQGSCADLLKQKLVELDNAGLGSQMILPIHDEVLLDVDAESSNEVKKILEQTMPVTDLSVVLDVEIDGPFARWGDKCRAKT